MSGEQTHAIYRGRVWHARAQPAHSFSYELFMLFIDLDQLEQLKGLRPWLGLEQRAIASLKRSDHLRHRPGSWREAAEQEARALGCTQPIHRIRVLCNARYLGFYFSPVNFYYLYGEDDQQPHSLMAEVSNTPWLERHRYLVPITGDTVESAKAFHVSPFMPLEMRYRWQIGVPGERLRLVLANWREQQEFEAGIDLQRLPLTASNLKGLLLRTPAMTMKIVWGIYWQAMRLWWRGARFHSHPSGTTR